MDRVTHVVLGDPPQGFTGQVLRRPRSVRGAAALYRARLQAIQQVETPYFSLLDESDTHSFDYVVTMEELAAQLDRSGLDIGCALETIDGAPSRSTEPHHGVVCRTSAVPDLPAGGCFHLETMLYGHLSKRGVLKVEKTVYDWRREANGAHRWPDTLRGILNAHHWLHGSTGVHFKGEH